MYHKRKAATADAPSGTAQVPRQADPSKKHKPRERPESQAVHPLSGVEATVAGTPAGKEETSNALATSTHRESSGNPAAPITNAGPLPAENDQSSQHIAAHAPEDAAAGDQLPVANLKDTSGSVDPRCIRELESVAPSASGISTGKNTEDWHVEASSEEDDDVGDTTEDDMGPMPVPKHKCLFVETAILIPPSGNITENLFACKDPASNDRLLEIGKWIGNEVAWFPLDKDRLDSGLGFFYGKDCMAGAVSPNERAKDLAQKMTGGAYAFRGPVVLLRRTKQYCHDDDDGVVEHYYFRPEDRRTFKQHSLY